MDIGNLEDLFDLNYMEFKDFDQAKEEMKKLSFRCLCLNVRSLRKNWDVFCALICSIANYVDVIVLVEININTYENSFYNLNGFNAELANRTHKKGGGIAIFIKN